MPQHHGAGFLAGDPLNIVPQPFGDTTQATILPRQRRADDRLHSPLGLRAFGDHHNTEATSGRIAVHDLLTDFINLPCDFGNQDHVGRARHTSVQRDKSGIATHDFQHHHTVVRLRRRVQLVDRFHGRVDGRVETERRHRAGDVVVDRLRHADHAHALGGELRSNLQRPVAADRDDRFDAQIARVLHELIRAIHILPRPIGLQHRIRERAATIRRFDDRAALIGDPPHAVLGERDDLVLAKEPGVAALNAKHIPAAGTGRKHRSPNDGVESRGVAAAGGNRNPHVRRDGSSGWEGSQ